MTASPGAAIVNRLLSPRTTVYDTAGWIRTVEPEEVPPEYAALCIRAASAAAESLAMDPESMVVYFFTRCAETHPSAAARRLSHMSGFVPKGEKEAMWLSVGLSATQLLETAAHEVRHVWQNREGWPAFHSKPQLEHDAREFGRAWAAGGLR